jgi:hypothetical protein
MKLLNRDELVASKIQHVIISHKQASLSTLPAAYVPLLPAPPPRPTCPGRINTDQCYYRYTKFHAQNQMQQLLQQQQQQQDAVP